MIKKISLALLPVIVLFATGCTGFNAGTAALEDNPAVSSADSLPATKKLDSAAESAEDLLQLGDKLDLHFDKSELNLNESSSINDELYFMATNAVYNAESNTESVYFLVSNTSLSRSYPIYAEWLQLVNPATGQKITANPADSVSTDQYFSSVMLRPGESIQAKLNFSADNSEQFNPADWQLMIGTENADYLRVNLSGSQ